MNQPSPGPVKKAKKEVNGDIPTSAVDLREKADYLGTAESPLSFLLARRVALVANRYAALADGRTACFNTKGRDYHG